MQIQHGTQLSRKHARAGQLPEGLIRWCARQAITARYSISLWFDQAGDQRQVNHSANCEYAFLDLGFGTDLILHLLSETPDNDEPLLPYVFRHLCLGLVEVI